MSPDDGRQRSDAELLALVEAESPSSVIARESDYAVVQNQIAVGGRLIDVRTPQKDVFAQAFIKKRCVLTHHRKEVAQVFKRHVPGCNAANFNRAGLGVDQTGEQVEDR